LAIYIFKALNLKKLISFVMNVGQFYQEQIRQKLKSMHLDMNFNPTSF